MDVKFIKCSSTKLSSVPIVDGQIICLTDVPYILYDMNGARKYATKCLSVSDSYTTSAGAASSGVCASSKAIYDAYTTLLNKFSSYQTRPTWVDTTAKLDALSYSDASFHWGYGLISNVAYFSVSIGWITLQFQIDVESLKARYKYGANAWKAWTKLM